MKVLAGLSLMPTSDFATAAFPLFEAGIVEVVEWSFDMSWRTKRTPEWLTDLLDFYSGQDRLLGHGVSFSPLSADWSHLHEDYVQHLSEETRHRKYLRISEHFGYARGGRFSYNTVLPTPLSKTALKRGIENLGRLKEASRLQVGLENLAFAFGPLDVACQGRFLTQLLHETDGYLVLDLHNAWCQMCNFSLDFSHFSSTYPLQRVREIHVSGGSWSTATATAQQLRRDTHDGPVPNGVFELLPQALQHCPNVEAVIFERLGNTMKDQNDYTGFQDDFRTLTKLLSQTSVVESEHSSNHSSKRKSTSQTNLVMEDNQHSLALFQHTLMDLLADEGSPAEVSESMKNVPELACYGEYLDSFQVDMVEIAQILVKKWGEL